MDLGVNSLSQSCFSRVGRVPQLGVACRPVWSEHTWPTVTACFAQVPSQQQASGCLSRTSQEGLKIDGWGGSALEKGEDDPAAMLSPELYVERSWY